MIKRLLPYIMILTLLSSGNYILHLFAHCVDYGRMYNRMHEFKTPESNTNFAQCQGEDATAGLNASASSSADKDWYLEDFPFSEYRRGIEYTASASCDSWNAYPNISEGWASAIAYVPNDTPAVFSFPFTGIVDGDLYKNSFTEMASVDDIDIHDELTRCDAGASISGYYDANVYTIEVDPSVELGSGSSSGSGPLTFYYATAVGNW